MGLLDCCFFVLCFFFLIWGHGTFGLLFCLFVFFFFFFFFL